MTDFAAPRPPPSTPPTEAAPKRGAGGRRVGAGRKRKPNAFRREDKISVCMPPEQRAFLAAVARSMSITVPHVVRRIVHAVMQQAIKPAPIDLSAPGMPACGPLRPKGQESFETALLSRPTQPSEAEAIAHPGLKGGDAHGSQHAIGGLP